MNKVELIGRLTRDPNVTTTQGQKPMTVAKFTLAVDRRFKRDNEQSADFISCVAFGKTAEVTEKYVKKGSKIGIVGHIQTGNYTDRDGRKVYTTDVIVDEMEFCESKASQSQNGNQLPPPSPDDGFMNIPDGIDDELPFK